MRENSSDIFNLLLATPPDAAQFMTHDTGIEIGDHSVLRALDSHARPMLLVPLVAMEEDINNGGSQVVRLETHVLTIAQTAARYLLVRCDDQTLSSQFSLMVDDMLRSIGLLIDMPGTACLRVLGRWRSLLQPTSTTLMSLDGQMGLIAELHLLEAVIAEVGANALSLWTGADRARHDFVSKSAAVEVKSTRSRDLFAVTIHGAKQLDPPAGGPLYLYAEQMEETPAGESLPEVIERISGIVDSVTFLDKLSAAGYRLDDASAYEDTKLGVLRRKICVVDSSFPRIGRDQLVLGSMLDHITRLDYSINIGPLDAVVPDESALNCAGKVLVSGVA